MKILVEFRNDDDELLTCQQWKCSQGKVTLQPVDDRPIVWDFNDQLDMPLSRTDVYQLDVK